VTAQDRQGDLLSDLLVDLQPGAAPDPPVPAPSVTPPPSPRSRPTPAFDLRITPLHWSLPRLVVPETGTGLGLRAGPVLAQVLLA
jgi:hypothetical protein